MCWNREEEEDGFEAAMQREVGEMKKKAKSVRFDDILDCGALGQMGGIRRSLLREDQRCRLKTQVGRGTWTECPIHCPCRVV